MKRAQQCCAPTKEMQWRTHAVQPSSIEGLKSHRLKSVLLVPRPRGLKRTHIALALPVLLYFPNDNRARTTQQAFNSSRRARLCLSRRLFRDDLHRGPQKHVGQTARRQDGAESARATRQKVLGCASRAFCAGRTPRVCRYGKSPAWADTNQWRSSRAHPRTLGDSSSTDRTARPRSSCRGAALLRPSAKGCQPHRKARIARSDCQVLQSHCLKAGSRRIGLDRTCLATELLRAHHP